VTKSVAYNEEIVVVLQLLGFVFIGAIVAKEKPYLPSISLFGESMLNQSYIEMMAAQEKETNAFLSAYYSQKIDQ